jgi:Family of unknown function (DUF5989)
MSTPSSDFEHAAAAQRDASLVRELGGLVYNTKKWWLVPVLVALLLIGLMLLASGSAAAPFIYTLF